MTDTVQPLLSGRKQGLLYSLSRWTDLPAAKWGWFKSQVEQGWMVGFDPRTAIPGKWDLSPDETLGLVFWTKDPENLLLDADLLKRYRIAIHMTLTGWEEVEKGAPDAEEGLSLLQDAVRVFGAERVTWRFSPVPAVDDVLDRFASLASKAYGMGLRSVFLSFLQENDLMPEKRPGRVREELLRRFASSVPSDFRVLLCAEDRTAPTPAPQNFSSGICESGALFVPGAKLQSEGCGCALAVDPFTINESCTMGCTYCYAALKDTSPRKRNTTPRSPRHLPVVK